MVPPAEKRVYIPCDGKAGHLKAKGFCESGSLFHMLKDFPVKDGWYIVGKMAGASALLLGEEKMALLAEKCVAVIGLGGVGGACAEGLCRAGIGKMILMDHDEVDETNINRQMIATHDTIGMPKTEACAQRLLSINPRLELVKLQMFYGADTAGQLFEQHPDYIIDCIDTVTAKLDLAARCQESGIPLLMSLGTGNRLDPTSSGLERLKRRPAAVPATDWHGSCAAKPGNVG